MASLVFSSSDAGCKASQAVVEHPIDLTAIAGIVGANLLDELLEGQDPATVLQSNGLVGELKKALAERILNAEMDVHPDF